MSLNATMEADPKTEIERLLMLDLIEGEFLRASPALQWADGSNLVSFERYSTDSEGNTWAQMKMDNGIIYGVNLKDLLQFERTKRFYKVYGKKEQKQPRLLANISAFLPFWCHDQDDTTF